MPFSRNIPYHVAVRLTAWYWVPVFYHLTLFTHPPPPTFSTFDTIRDHSPLFATIRHYSRLFASIRDRSPLFATVRHYSRMFATIRDCSPLFATVRHYSRLPAICYPRFPVTPLYPWVCEMLFVLLQFYHVTAELRSLGRGTHWTVGPQCILAYSFRKLTSTLVCTIIRCSVATCCLT